MNQHNHNQPQHPLELKIFQSLQARKDLSNDGENAYNNYLKGYKGEMKFSQFLTQLLPRDRILLHSLRLLNDGSEFQVDSMLFWHNTIYLFEVKNFSGDFYIKNKNWYVASTGKEINNPHIQLSRSDSLLRQKVQKLGFNHNIYSYLVFVHPEFTLFQAPMNLPMILPGQMNRFFRKLTQNPYTPRDQDRQLAHIFVESNIVRSSHERLPEYYYGDLKKGIICRKCSRFMSLFNKNIVICPACGSKETNNEAIIRSVHEFHLLFPEKQISTGNISQWTQLISPKSIRRVLSKNFRVVRKGRSTFYII